MGVANQRPPHSMAHPQPGAREVECEAVSGGDRKAPDYTSSLDAVAEAEKVVVERFGAQKYGHRLTCEALDMIIVGTGEYENYWEGDFDQIVTIATASADVRCRAIKKLFGGESR